MVDLNKVLLVGRLTRDPEVRAVSSGVMVAEFGIAYNRRRRDSQTGEQVDETSFFDIKAWRRDAEFAQQYLHKGKAVLIEGKLSQESWEKDGQRRSKVVIVADRITFAESKAEESARSGGEYAGGAGAPRAARPAPAAAPSDMPPMPGDDDRGAADDLPF